MIKQRKILNKLDKVIIKKGLRAQVSLTKLIADYFWRSWTGPFFAFIFPIIYTALLGFLMSYNMTLGSATCMGPIIIAIYALPTSVYDFKKSSLLKRIGVTPLNPAWFLLCICMFYLFIMILSLLFCFAISLAMFSMYWHQGPTMTYRYTDDIRMRIRFMSLSDVVRYIDYGAFIFSFFLIIVVGTTLGMVIVSVSKTSMQLQSFSVLILIITIIIGGQAIPMYIIKDVPTLWYIGYAVNPFKPIINMATEAWNGPIPMNSLGTGLISGETIELWDKDLNAWGPLRSTHLQNWGGPHDLFDDASKWYTQSTVWNVNDPYYMFSTIMLPGINPGPVEILNKSEKIISFILPFVWMVIFCLSTIKLFKWSSR